MSEKPALRRFRSCCMTSIMTRQTAQTCKQSVPADAPSAKAIAPRTPARAPRPGGTISGGSRYPFISSATRDRRGANNQPAA